jgi:hypothetical protein
VLIYMVIAVPRSRRRRAARRATPPPPPARRSLLGTAVPTRRRIPGCGGLVTPPGGLIPLPAHPEPLQRRLVALIGRPVAPGCLPVAAARPPVTVTADPVAPVGQPIAPIGQIVTLVGGTVTTVGTAVGHRHLHLPAAMHPHGLRAAYNASLWLRPNDDREVPGSWLGRPGHQPTGQGLKRRPLRRDQLPRGRGRLRCQQGICYWMAMARWSGLRGGSGGCDRPGRRRSQWTLPLKGRVS